MPVETGTTISALIASWPLSGDFVSEGDNHLNLIKDVLKKQFPGVNNQGFAKVILATEDELNFVQGASSNIQAQIDAIEVGEGGSEFPASTTMVFFNPFVPPGWTQLTSNNDSMLRVVSDISLGGGSGGSQSPVGHTHATVDHTLTSAEMPFHTHAMFKSTSVGGSPAAQPGSSVNIAYQGSTGDSTKAYSMAASGGGTNVGVTVATGANGAHNHGNVSSHLPRYINMITAVKD